MLVSSALIPSSLLMISNLSNDELRNKTALFKQRIAEGTLEFTSKIEALKRFLGDKYLLAPLTKKLNTPIK